MKLTPAEKETIILSSEADDTASVYTYDHRLKKKLNALSVRFPEQFRLTESLRCGGVCYTVPKRCIVIYPPQTDEQRAAARERAKTTGFQPKNADR